MPTVRFLPADVTAEVPDGTLIHEAAIRAGIIDLHLPCGGKGTCGQCLVEVISGQPEQMTHTRLEEALAGRGLVMACQTKVREDLTVRLTQTNDAAMRVVGDSHFLVSQELLPDGRRLTPLYRVERLTVPPATIEEHYSDWARLVRELMPDGDPLPVRTSLNVLRNLAETLRAQDGKVTIVLQDDEAGIKVVSMQPGHIRKANLMGLAIDIGTTTVAVQLVHLIDGQVLANKTSYNAQISRGSDVISRIDYARTPERLVELRKLVLDTINELIGEVMEEVEVNPHEVHAAFIAGNTTMIHLLLGLPPRHIRETPYVPTVNPTPSLTAIEVGLNIDPHAVVAFAPGVGSYVGGDITSGLLCTQLPYKRDDVYLFLDIGTNGEIVLGNADWMVTCACSAGPAFEGSGIKCGTRATEGAIEYLEISPDAQSVRYDIIGDGKPIGVCGSGLICLLGELLINGIVDQSGRFNMELPTDRLVQLESTRGFVLEWGDKTSDGQDLIITEHDIENLMRTKAAIYAACSLILQNVGIDWSAITRVYIAGGFGRYIQVEDAIQIGLLPDLPYDRFTYIGNSSLTGAYIALLSRSRRQKLTTIASTMTYVDLSSDPHYMDSYLGAMFLPHTELALFPSVAARLAAVREKVNSI
ncbi:MAG: ASKHA domain-containing protein [Armatimonadota bacterium]